MIEKWQKDKLQFPKEAIGGEFLIRIQLEPVNNRAAQNGVMTADIKKQLLAKTSEQLQGLFDIKISQNGKATNTDDFRLKMFIDTTEGTNIVLTARFLEHNDTAKNYSITIATKKYNFYFGSTLVNRPYLIMGQGTATFQVSVGVYECKVSWTIKALPIVTALAFLCVILVSCFLMKALWHSCKYKPKLTQLKAKKTVLSQAPVQQKTKKSHPKMKQARQTTVLEKQPLKADEEEQNNFEDEIIASESKKLENKTEEPSNITKAIAKLLEKQEHQKEQPKKIGALDWDQAREKAKVPVKAKPLESRQTAAFDQSPVANEPPKEDKAEINLMQKNVRTLNRKKSLAANKLKSQSTKKSMFNPDDNPFLEL